MTREELNLIFIYFLNYTFLLLIFQIYHNSYQYNETYELTHFTQRCDIQITSNYVRDFIRLKIENMGVNEYIIKT